jgi:hypothetical protein
MISLEHQGSRQAIQTCLPPARSSPRSLASSTSHVPPRRSLAAPHIGRHAVASQPPDLQQDFISPPRSRTACPRASVDNIGTKPDLPAPRLLAPGQREQAPLWWGCEVILPFCLDFVVVLAMLTDPVVCPLFRFLSCCFGSALYNLLSMTITSNDLLIYNYEALLFYSSPL